MNRSFYTVLILMCVLVLWGCASNDSDNDNDNSAEIALGSFLEAYQEGSAEKMKENAIGSENLLQEIDDLIALLYYDEESSEIIRTLMRDFPYEIGEVLEASNNTLTISLDVELPQLYFEVVSDMSSLFEEEDLTFVPMQNDFAELNTYSESCEVVLKKDGDAWKVDLTDDGSKSLVNTMAGNFIDASRMCLQQDFQKNVFDNAELPPMPNNEIVLMDGGTERVYDVNPMQRDDRLGIPFYGEPVFHDVYYLSWQEEPPTLTAIRPPGTVVTLPFVTVPIGNYEVTWWDMAAVKVETLEPAP